MFISFGKKNFEIPDEIILGSGIIFNIHEDELAPVHARLRSGKNGVEIRDLGHGVSINGTRIPVKQWIQLNEADIILVGNIPLKLLSGPAPDMKQILSIHTPVAQKEYKSVVPIILFLAAMSYWVMDDMPLGDRLFFFAILGLACVCFLFDILFKTSSGFSSGYFSEHGVAMFHRGRVVCESSYAGIEWQLFRNTFLIVIEKRKYQVKTSAKQKLEAILANRARPYVVQPIPYLAPALMGLLILLFFV